MLRKAALVLAALTTLSAPYALAQTAPGAPGTSQVIPEKQGEPINSGRSDSLSDKLDESGGVIKPKPGVDPGIVKPAPVPEPNSTPVIPPSGPEAK
ncbi:hypothetical protein Msil_1083 [Methylocella silvestris BL2]|uniref:Uncharacterized protein n=1 Tax=Methylocella silvestris (strain DSM 15510 / CIP 108128 / LMG 27833 / NCIMB 13906 / BL2) TaxID=395965 RepID=B8ELQ8_METSB|nr:hypothetical protein [Methylocella silvestris]ACK50052.1 hypothetical protein Msil_1083 [Methylocella silvestris BL2]